MKKVGEYPVNSTIIIDYSREKPVVNFEYPEKDSQIKSLHNSSGIYLLNILCVLFLALILFLLNIYFAAPPAYVKDCVLYQYEFEKEHSAFQSGQINCTTFDTNETISFYASYSPMTGINTSSKESYDYFPIYALIFIFIFYFINPYLLKRFFVKTRLGNKLFPVWNRFLMNKRYSAEFTTCPDIKVIEIPLFSNIYMDYEADGQFGDYLQRIEIVPHAFNHHMKKGRKRIVEGNYHLWKTRFIFKEVPKDGYLRVRWT